MSTAHILGLLGLFLIIVCGSSIYFGIATGAGTVRMPSAKRANRPVLFWAAVIANIVGVILGAIALFVGMMN